MFVVEVGGTNDELQVRLVLQMHGEHEDPAMRGSYDRSRRT